MATSSALFSPYRTIGLVCGGSQQHQYSLGSATFLATPIGKAFQVYNTDHLSLAMVSRPIPYPISHIVCKKETSFAVTEAGIYVFIRSRPLSRRLTWDTTELQSGEVVQLLQLGDNLFSLHHTTKRDIIRVWDAAAAERDEEDVLINTISLPNGIAASTIMHPDTYINKVAVGTTAGSVLIVNVRTGKLIYECKIRPGAAVRCIAQSDVADVVAVGFSDGAIVVYNLLTDKELFTLMHSKADEGITGGITGLCFSFDNTLLQPTLASVSESGSIALWNLDTKTLLSLTPVAHDGHVSHIGFLPRQPCLLTAGSDNAVHVWTVDKLDGSIKRLRSRSGHQAPPRVIRYYAGASVASIASGATASACEIVSAGADRCVRMFHTGLDRQNCELSQGSLAARARSLGVSLNALRLPPVTALAVSDRQHGQWSDVVTVHSADSKAYIWSWENKRLEDRVLQMKDSEEDVTAICISSCGHFAVAGGTRGTLCKFNLQSAARRGCFPKEEGDALLVPRGKKRQVAHEGAIGEPLRDVGKGKRASHKLHLPDSVDATLWKVAGLKPRSVLAAEGKVEAPTRMHSSMITGVAVDAFNSQLVSCDVKGVVCFWDFSTHALKDSFELASPAAFITLHRDSNLLAIACDDFAVRLIDMATRRIVRTFVGHSNRLSDVTFSPDGRLLVTASLDRTIRVWDVPSTKCVDWLVFHNAVTSVTFSPTDEYLVTSHVDSNGLCLWGNKAHFGSAVLDVSPSQPFAMDVPPVDVSETAEDAVEDADRRPKRMRVTSETRTASASATEPEPADATATARLKKDDCHISLSGVPPSHWQNLTKLDIIAARNKPIEPPKKPESAPFFLPTTAGINPVFVAPQKADADGKPEDEAAAFPAAWTDTENADADGEELAAVETKEVITRNGSRLLTAGKRVAQTALATLLREFAKLPTDDDARLAVYNHLVDLAPAAADAEIRSLCLNAQDADGMFLLSALLHYFDAQIRDGQGFELTQAQLNLTLKIYETTILESPSLAAIAKDLQSAMAGDAIKLRRLLDKGLCMISLFLGQ